MGRRARRPHCTSRACTAHRTLQIAHRTSHIAHRASRIEAHTRGRARVTAHRPVRQSPADVEEEGALRVGAVLLYEVGSAVGDPFDVVNLHAVRQTHAVPIQRCRVHPLRDLEPADALHVLEECAVLCESRLLDLAAAGCEEGVRSYDRGLGGRQREGERKREGEREREGSGSSERAASGQRAGKQ